MGKSYANFYAINVKSSMPNSLKCLRIEK